MIIVVLADGCWRSCADRSAGLLAYGADVTYAENNEPGELHTAPSMDEALAEADRFIEYSQMAPDVRDAVERQLERQTALARDRMRLQWAGLAAGFLIAVAFLVAGLVLVSTGHSTSGTVLATADLLVVAAVFVAGRRTLEATTASERRSRPRSQL